MNESTIYMNLIKSTIRTSLINSDRRWLRDYMKPQAITVQITALKEILHELEEELVLVSTL